MADQGNSITTKLPILNDVLRHFDDGHDEWEEGEGKQSSEDERGVASEASSVWPNWQLECFDVSRCLVGQGRALSQNGHNASIMTP